MKPTSKSNPLNGIPPVSSAGLARTAPDAVSTRIGSRVLAARRGGRLTRERLAELSGVSERYLNQLEKGEANASIGVLGRVASALDVSLVALIEEAPSVRPQGPRHAPLADLLAGMSLAEQVEAHRIVERFLAERRRTCHGIALLGLRGAGKSTLARRLAEHTGLPHESVTSRIEDLAGVQVNELFNLGGPDAYRNLENEAIATLIEGGGFVILETAGGVVANTEAFGAILANFRTVWLKASPEEHLGRVQRQGDMRPMKGNPRALENIKALLGAREADYARADVTIDTSGRSVEDCLQALVALVQPLLATRGSLAR